MADETPGTIDLDTAAKLALCTPRWIQKLVSEGYIQKVNGRYTITGVVHGRIKHLQDEERRSSKTAAQSRLQDERTEEVRLRNIDKQKVLIEQAQGEAVRVIDEIAGPLRADLMAIPAQVTNDLKLRRAIEGRIDGAFGEASKRAVVAANRIATAGEALGTKAPAKPGPVGKRKPGVSAKRGRSRKA